MKLFVVCLYFVALPVAIAQAARTLRGRSGRVHLAVAAASAIAVTITFLLLDVVQGRPLRASADAGIIVLALPVVGGFWVGTWPSCRASRWLTFLLVPAIYWAVFGIGFTVTMATRVIAP
jgi:hypothetical protein